MLETFSTFHPVLQALIAGLFTWSCTIVGSSFVFLFKEINQKFLDIMNGFAAGVMIAASFWSLLAPAITNAENSGYGIWSFFPAAVGFLVGGFFLRLIDVVIPHLHLNEPEENKEGPKTKASKNLLLFLAITIHNIPEGLSVGVAFGATAIGVANGDTFLSAVGLALGIGIQNIPEGSALSMPIRAAGSSRWRAFNIGQLSAIVEPIAAVIGAVAVISISAILPYALAFAAGAMIFVVVEELIPESQTNGNKDSATLALMVGFTIMMILDVALG
ncbi:ZIP family metal transporter [Marinilactibacillus sp. XAAS-LB27]|uniref:ZIP family metal transporter n=1 Tax=Marinilactibacillus sp. XAAS-LB27 TaxID=3114538 RepID=UPI002E17750A|nr:ZIP family metal transporter [Marinilactibacillus sp. XAAS-LB27]